jgi:DJ-1/PfpI family
MLSFHHIIVISIVMLSIVATAGRLSNRFITKSTRHSSALKMAFSDSKLSREVLVAIADGSEEIEAVTIVDTLVRSGATVTLASVGDSLQVRCSRGVKIVADKLISECSTIDWDLM